MKHSITILAILFVSFSTLAQDMYLEYQTTGTMQGMDGTNKMYISPASGLRLEMEMNLPKAGKMTTVTIMPKGKNISYSYNSMSKTYFETTFDAKSMEEKEPDIKIELVGKEKIGPYNCTHIKIIMTKKVVSDMWTTKDIDGYQVMETLTKNTTNFGSNKVYRQLKSAGADGLAVKMVMNVGDKTMTNQLIKAEKRSSPASMFVLPAGYKKMIMPNIPKH